jgi:hypothetical protein
VGKQFVEVNSFEGRGSSCSEHQDCGCLLGRGIVGRRQGIAAGRIHQGCTSLTLIIGERGGRVPLFNRRGLEWGTGRLTYPAFTSIHHTICGNGGELSTLKAKMQAADFTGGVEGLAFLMGDLRQRFQAVGASRDSMV